MLKAGEVFEIAMLAHGTPPLVQNAAHRRAVVLAQVSSFRKPRKRLSGIHTHDRGYGFRACAKWRIPE
jgi:hypothetical protein